MMTKSLYLLVFTFLVSLPLKINYSDHYDIHGNSERLSLNYNVLANNDNLIDSVSILKKANQFMTKWDLKGISLAIIKNEKLVYAKGFGEANDSQPMLSGNIFRVASVSKLITAVAIMKLVEEGKLSLDDKVFGSGGILNFSELDDVVDKRIYDITVRHLLVHTAGWTNRYGDLAFNPLLISQLINEENPVTNRSFYKFIASTKLARAPGQMVVYSNLGYIFLAEVINNIAGESYESYVRNKILIPNGITDMHLGDSSRNSRFPNEVAYYAHEGSELTEEWNGSGLMVEKTYGGNPIELLTGAGGWVCSAIELARFITLIDGESAVPDILSQKSIQEMTDNNYAVGPLGWASVTENGEWSRTGSMTGTMAMVKKQNDGIYWVFLSNSSSWKGSNLSKEISVLMKNISDEIQYEPDYDLFNFYKWNSLAQK